VDLAQQRHAGGGVAILVGADDGDPLGGGFGAAPRVVAVGGVVAGGFASRVVVFAVGDLDEEDFRVELLDGGGHAGGSCTRAASARLWSSLSVSRTDVSVGSGGAAPELVCCALQSAASAEAGQPFVAWVTRDPPFGCGWAGDQPSEPRHGGVTGQVVVRHPRRQVRFGL
jgi:hypothetical protein